MAKYLRLHGEIGEGDCAAAVFIEALDAVPKSQPVYVSVNSPGGDFFDGVAIHSAIARRGNVTIMVDGLAASAASYIAMGARKIVMAAGSMLMVHSPLAGARGNPVQIESALNTLKKLEREMAEVYARRSSITVDEMLILMRAETWMDGALAKQIFSGIEINTDKVAASIEASWIEGFRNVPLALTVAARTAEKMPPAKVDPAQQKLERERVARRRRRLILMQKAREVDPEQAARQRKRRSLELQLEASNLRAEASAREVIERDLAACEAAKAALTDRYYRGWTNIPRRTW